MHNQSNNQATTNKTKYSHFLREILSKKEAAEFCGFSIPTLDRLVRKGEFAPKIQLSARRVGFYKQDLCDWLNSRKCHN